MQEVRSPKILPIICTLVRGQTTASEPSGSINATPLAGKAPDELIPAVASADKDNRQLNLLLVHSADEHLQASGPSERHPLPGTGHPDSNVNRQLVINALTG